MSTKAEILPDFQSNLPAKLARLLRLVLALCAAACLFAETSTLAAQQQPRVQNIQTGQSTRRSNGYSTTRANGPANNSRQPARQQYPVQPAAAQFPHTNENVANSPQTYAPHVHSTATRQSGTMSATGDSSQNPPRFDGYQLSNPLPKSATERALELAAENSELRAILQQRNEENKNLKAELIDCQHAMIAANHAVATTANRIDQVAKALAARDRQIVQMQHLVNEHETVTSGRLQRLMTTISRSFEISDGATTSLQTETPDSSFIVPENIENQESSPQDSTLVAPEPLLTEPTALMLKPPAQAASNANSTRVSR